MTVDLCIVWGCFWGTELNKFLTETVWPKSLKYSLGGPYRKHLLTPALVVHLYWHCKPNLDSSNFKTNKCLICDLPWEFCLPLKNFFKTAKPLLYQPRPTTTSSE